MQRGSPDWYAEGTSPEQVPVLNSEDKADDKEAGGKAGWGDEEEAPWK